MLLDEKIDGISSHRNPHFVKFALSNTKYLATRYKISDEVTEEIAWLMIERPHLLLNNFQFAIAPKPEPPIYVEWDAYRAINLFARKEVGNFDEFAPDKVNYLLDNDRYLGIILKENVIVSLVCGRDTTKPFLHYVCYGIGDNHHIPPDMAKIKFGNTEEDPAIIKANDPDSDIERKLSFLLGATYTNERTRLTNKLIDWLVNNVHVYMEKKYLIYQNNYNKIVQRLQDCCGEFRFMMSMLLWINQQHVTYHDRIPASRGMRERGRPIAFAAHNVVKLHKHKNIRKAIIRSLIRRAGPRRHDVRPTWRTINVKEGCVHNWPMFPDERGHFVCQSCEAKRFRVKKHMRGDATKGCVVKEYVT